MRISRLVCSTSRSYLTPWVRCLAPYDIVARVAACKVRGGCGVNPGEGPMQSGLDNVVAAETVLSHTDRERGMIWVRGVALPDLVASHGYEGRVALLWEGFAGQSLTRTAIHAELGASRQAAFAGLGAWLDEAAHRPLAEGVRLC